MEQDPHLRIRQLERRVQQLEAQARRDFEEIDWGQAQVRVYRRLVEKLLREKYREDNPPCAPTT